MHEPSAEAAVEVVDLVKRYGAVRAVDRASFTVPAGTVFGLLGPNGAGKTTTVECVEGLRRADAGEIRVLGIDQPRGFETLKQRMGVQLQATGLYAKLTVAELVGLFAALYGAERSSVNRLVEAVGLSESRNVRVQNLSGGQRQRLLFALCMVNDPELMFLDEPTTGLDPQGRRAVWDLIRGAKDRGKTILLTTHYMEEAEQLCDTVAIMDHGRIIEMGTPAGLITRYFKETAIEFADEAQSSAASRAGPSGVYNELPGVTNVVRANGRVTLYSVDVPRTMASLLSGAGSSSWSVPRDLIVRQATLEDVFLKLTGRRIRE